MQKHLRFLILLAILASAGCALVRPPQPLPGGGAAADGGDDGGTTEITLMRFFGDCFDDFGENEDLDAAYGECGIIQTLTNSFNASQDDVYVETQVVDWPGFAKLNSNLAAGTPPEVMVLHGIRIPNYTVS